MTKIVLLNGPPGSGKDTFANMLAAAITDRKVETVKFAAPLKSVVMHLFCGGDSKLFHDLDLDQVKKKEPRDDLFFTNVKGEVVSCRQAQIDVSEKYLKVIYGDKIFGRILANTIEKKSEAGTEIFFVSDSGFKPEALVLAEEFGKQNILLIRLHREGHTYDGDSRDYVNLDEEGIQSYDVENFEGDVNFTLKTLTDLVTKFIQ